jgi:hypothetical protein
LRHRLTPLEGGQGFGGRIGDLRRERHGSRSGESVGGAPRLV